MSTRPGPIERLTEQYGTSLADRLPKGAGFVLLATDGNGGPFAFASNVSPEDMADMCRAFAAEVDKASHQG